MALLAARTGRGAAAGSFEQKAPAASSFHVPRFGAMADPCTGQTGDRRTRVWLWRK